MRCWRSDHVGQIRSPEPVIRVAIEPETKDHQEKISVALGRLAEEDPTFEVLSDEETGRIEIAGMGELDLESLVGRMMRELEIGATVRRPQIIYLETIRGTAEKIEGRFRRQTGSLDQRGVMVCLDVEPAPREGFDFVNATTCGAVPREFIPVVQSGIESVLESGPVAGSRVVDVRFTLIDGANHDTYSTASGWGWAALVAAREALQRADPVLLEPVFAVEVVAPEELMGEVIRDLNRRRGHVSGIEQRGDAQVVTGDVPLAEMLGYAAALRSNSQGRAACTMQFERYDDVPPNIAAKVRTAQQQAA